VSKTTVVSILFLLAVLGALVYSTMDLQGYSCEVCITFNGRQNCAKASGTSREEAQRTATDTACAPITGGMSETIACSNTTPDSVNWY
jgi:hypothetical protein